MRLPSNSGAGLCVMYGGARTKHGAHIGRLGDSIVDRNSEGGLGMLWRDPPRHPNPCPETRFTTASVRDEHRLNLGPNLPSWATLWPKSANCVQVSARFGSIRPTRGPKRPMMLGSRRSSSTTFGQWFGNFWATSELVGVSVRDVCRATIQ